MRAIGGCRPIQGVYRSPKAGVDILVPQTYRKQFSVWSVALGNNGMVYFGGKKSLEHHRSTIAPPLSGLKKL